tara:strand:- start:133 stop:453 length:321 start_codon:yes stop_codon:yes gene_type:complete
MSLTLVKKPKFAKRVDYTHEERQKSFEEFYQLANKYHKLTQIGRRKSDIEDLRWKDELIAVINPRDFNRFQDAVAYVCGSPLETEEIITRTKHLVYASGYWNCVGA